MNGSEGAGFSPHGNKSSDDAFQATSRTISAEAKNSFSLVEKTSSPSMRTMTERIDGDGTGGISKIKMRITYYSTLTGITMWLIAIFAAPYFKSKSSTTGAFLYSLFAPVCHQLPQRSFHLFGYPLAVCGRCLGIYAGFFFGTIVFPLIKSLKQAGLPSRTFLLVLSFPIVFDTAGNFFKLWSTANPIRLVLGMSWGMILPYFFIPAVASIRWKKTGRW